MKKITITLAAVVLSLLRLSAQTTLSSGDIALIALNTDDEKFAFVTLVDLAANTEIYFTDEEPSGSTITGGEGLVLYTASASVAKGTVIEFSGLAGDFSAVSSSAITGNIVLGNSGDGITAVQGFDLTTGAVTTYLHQIGEDAGDVGTPSGLTSGDQVLLGADNGQFSGNRTGSASALYASISNASNFTTSGSFSGVATTLTSFTVTSSVTPTFTTTVTVNSNVSCNGFSDGAATAMGVGTGPFTYAWSNGATSASNTSLAAGTYYVTVSNGVASVVDSAIITEPVVLAGSIAVNSNVTTNGGSDGSLTGSATGGTSPYIYQWSNGATTATAANLFTGTYTVTISDGNSCTTSLSETITQPSSLVASAVVDSNVTCNGLSDGGATASFTGGTGRQAYAWSTGSASASITGLAAGTYTVTVSDNSGTTATAVVSITEPAVLAAAVVVDSNVSVNAGTDGGATASATGGTTPYVYTWSNGATTASITGIAAGTYTTTVTDANGCTSSNNTTITEPVAMGSLANLIITEINYNGPESGSDTSEFVEFVNAGSTTVNLNNYTFSQGVTYTFGAQDSIQAGQYFVVAFDSAAFRNTYGLDADAIWSTGGLSNSGEDITIVDNFGRTVDSVDYDDGGVWPSGFSAGEPDGGGASIVLCDINTDNNDGVNWSAATSAVSGKIVNGQQILGNPAMAAPCISPLAISTVVDSNVTCNGFTNGGATVAVSTGNMPYTYVWSNAAATASITGIAAGQYFITVTDNAGLTAVDSVTITEPTAMAAASVIDSNITCNGFADGGATASATGGTMPYVYAWSNGATTASITGIAAGTYTVTTTDANGCTSTSTASVTEPTVLVASSVVDSNVTVNGGTNGGATASATGGTTPYVYAWSNGATTASITGLAAGTYTTTVTDANGCTAVAGSATITQPTTISLSAVVDSNVTCNGLSDGGATASATGGLMPYTYLWSNAATTASVTGITAGTYTVTITDAANVTSNATVTITEPTALVASVVVDSNVTTNGGADGGATASVTGGTMPYTYTWSNGATTASITGIAAGTYTVTTTDANGCTTNGNATITQPAAMTVSGTASNVSCNAGNDGAIDITVVNGVAPITYLWSNGEMSEDIDTLAAGTYSVTVTDVNSATATASFTITEPTAIVVNVVVDSNVTCNGDVNGGLTATATGGTGNLTYLWSAGNRNLAAQSFESATNDTWNFVMNPGTYNTEGDSVVAGSDDVWAVIEEFTGNIDTASNGLYFWGIQDIDNGNGGGAFYHTLSFDAIDVSAENDVKVSFDYYSQGFDTSDSIEYQVQFNNGTNWDSNGVVLNKNSQAWTTVTVDVPDTANFVRLRLQAKQNGSSDYAGFDNVQLFTGSSSITGVGAGSYMVTVTDSLGCTSTASGTITEPTVLTATLAATDASTVGGADGSITATVSGGTPSYTYAWSNGATTASNTGLIAGTYFVTITDANGCSLVDSAMVSDPAAVVLSLSSTNISCFGAADGTATVNVTGGAAPYTYSWSPSLVGGATVSGLAAGTYIVTVTDAVGTTAIDSVTIVEPAQIQLTLAVSNATAAGATDGSIDLTVNGGTPGFSYNWSTAATTEDISGLAAGTYTVIVTDTNGCVATDSAQVLEPGAIANLVITEINYNGPESGTDTSEFIEIVNLSGRTVNLNGYYFSQGVGHTFGVNDSIGLGQYFVIAYDSSAFRNVYGFDADAVWTSGGLSNGGEDITLVDNFNRTIDSVDFDDNAPWPVNSATIGPDGNGTSIEFSILVSNDNNDGTNWLTSSMAIPGVIVNGFQVFGTPGNPNTTSITKVEVNQNVINVYPNPVRDVITIEKSNTELEGIQVISIDGKLVRDLQSAQTQIELDLSDLENGVYFLRIGSETKRVILSK